MDDEVNPFVTLVVQLLALNAEEVRRFLDRGIGEIEREEDALQFLVNVKITGQGDRRLVFLDRQLSRLC